MRILFLIFILLRTGDVEGYVYEQPSLVECQKLVEQNILKEGDEIARHIQCVVLGEQI